MTNAEAFIGDEDLIDTFIDEFNEFACKQDWDLEHHYLKERLQEFFKQERTPTLTDDERVILRNLNSTYIIIKRNNYGLLLMFDACTSKWIECQFKLSLFKFIQERRRIRNS